MCLRAYKNFFPLHLSAIRPWDLPYLSQPCFGTTQTHGLMTPILLRALWTEKPQKTLTAWHYCKRLSEHCLVLNPSSVGVVYSLVKEPPLGWLSYGKDTQHLKVDIILNTVSEVVCCISCKRQGRENTCISGHWKLCYSQRKYFPANSPSLCPSNPVSQSKHNTEYLSPLPLAYSVAIKRSGMRCWGCCRQLSSEVWIKSLRLRK